MENTEIKAYVSRYIVPFYFEYENDGYDKIRENFFKELTVNPKCKEEKKRVENRKKELGISKDCEWKEVGFWTNYKENTQTGRQAEMDIYTYLLHALKESNQGEKNNLGTSIVLATNGTLFNLQYKPIKDDDRFVGIRCKDLGILLFRNGLGFVWYDIEFSKVPDISTYLKVQQKFKELASDQFQKKVNKDCYEPFCVGEWLADLIAIKENKIKFWASRKKKREEETRYIPDKAWWFQYIFVDESGDADKYKWAFQIANGYDEKYNPPVKLCDEIYEPFANACFYTSKAGMAYVVSNKDSNDVYFGNNFKAKFIRDYFFIYVLLLYQSYSCAHYSRLLTKLPADAKDYEGRSKEYLEKFESLDNQINLFLVKSVYESVSNIQHQNGMYQYSKKRLALEGDIKSLTIGLDALRGIEKEKNQKVEEEKDRNLNIAIAMFGLLTCISAILDATTLVDRVFQEEIGRKIGYGVICVVIFLLARPIIAICTRNRRGE